MNILSRIVICWLVTLAAAIGYDNPARAAEYTAPGGVMTNSVVPGGTTGLASSWELVSNRHAARQQASVWRKNAADVSDTREISIEPYGHRQPDDSLRSFRADRPAPADSLDARPRKGTPPVANRESATLLNRMFRAAGEVLPGNLPGKATSADRQSPVGVWDEQSGEWVESGREEVWDERSGEALGAAGDFGLPSVESPLSLQSLNAFDWLVILTVLVVIAVRAGLWDYLNHAVFLWTAPWQNVAVAAGGDYQRSQRRRSSRSSSWTRTSGSRRSSWSPYGSRPSRRRSGHQGHARRRTASKSHSSRSAPPRERRRGRAREYVVSDVVFTNGGPVGRSVRPPFGGLLSYSTDSPPNGQKPGDRTSSNLQGGHSDRAQE